MQFTDQSVPGGAAIDTWAWEFGDGAASGERNPLHAYPASGSYAVTETVTDAEGQSGSTRQDVQVSSGPTCTGGQASLVPPPTTGEPQDSSDGSVARADTDHDGIRDAVDDCPTAANAGQSDLDGDGLGDACDPDIDGDGVANLADDCPAVADPGQEDLDRDGLGDACDPDIDGDSVCNPPSFPVHEQDPWKPCVGSDDCPTIPNRGVACPQPNRGATRELARGAAPVSGPQALALGDRPVAQAPSAAVGTGALLALAALLLAFVVRRRAHAFGKGRRSRSEERP